jgi:hypothetical protein
MLAAVAAVAIGTLVQPPTTTLQARMLVVALIMTEMPSLLMAMVALMDMVTPTAMVTPMVTAMQIVVTAVETVEHASIVEKMGEIFGSRSLYCYR